MIDGYKKIKKYYVFTMIYDLIFEWELFFHNGTICRFYYILRLSC
jgi:hypothetical protein